MTGTIALPDSKFGFSIRGGIDKMDGGVFVSDVKPRGNLDRDGRFGVGDEILAINGVAVASLTHREVIKVFRANKARVSLSVLSAQVGVGEESPRKATKAPAPAPAPAPVVAQALKAVPRPQLAPAKEEEEEEEDDAQDWGATTSLSPTKASAPPALARNTTHEDDEDDENENEDEEEEGIDLIHTTVSRPNVSTSFGFELGTIDDGTQVVARVSPESPADDAELQAGDVIVSVNNVPVEAMSHVELIQAIMKLTEFDVSILRNAAPEGVEDNKTAFEMDEGEVTLVEVTLVREHMDQSYGFGLGTATTGEQIISRVSPGGHLRGALNGGRSGRED